MTELITPQEKAEWAIAYASHNWRERVAPKLRNIKQLARGGRAETFRAVARDLRGFAAAMEQAALYDEGKTTEEETAE